MLVLGFRGLLLFEDVVVVVRELRVELEFWDRERRVLTVVVQGLTLRIVC